MTSVARTPALIELRCVSCGAPTLYGAGACRRWRTSSGRGAEAGHRRCERWGG